MMAGGRPSKYKDEYAEKAYKLCLLSATDKDIADFFEVTLSTLNLWKKEHIEFSDSLKAGKEDADAVIASKLYHRAKGYDHKEIITASYQGKITDTMEVVKHYPPDTTAAIFWLKNRQPAKWRDRQELDVNGSVANPLTGLTTAEIRAMIKSESDDKPSDNQTSTD